MLPELGGLHVDELRRLLYRFQVAQEPLLLLGVLELGVLAEDLLLNGIDLF